MTKYIFSFAVSLMFLTLISNAQVKSFMRLTTQTIQPSHVSNNFASFEELAVAVDPAVTDGQIIVTCPTQSVIEIFSMNGKRIAKIKTNLQSVPVNLNAEENGSYFIYITSGKYFWVKKIILKK